MHQTKTNPDKKFGSIFVQRRYDAEHSKAALHESNDKDRIFCIRHGQTALDALHRSDGWLDLPLNDEGRQNVVIALAEYLKGVPITCIYTSSLRRTDETATIIKSGLSSDPKIEKVPEIKTWNLGDLAGDPKKPNKKVVKDLLNNPDKAAPEGESYNEFKGRFEPWVKKMQKEVKEDGPFLFVLSGSNCRHLSEMILHDRNALDIDEAGLFILYPDEDGKWNAEVISKKRSEEDIKNNPEKS